MAAGFGVDIWCTDSLHTGRLARGADVVVQALYRRFITPQGTLPAISDDDEDLAYGFDVAAYVGAVGTDTAVAALPGLMRAQGLKDYRIAELAFAVTVIDEGAGLVSLEIEGQGVLHDEGETFELTLSTDGVTLELLS